MRCRFLLYVVLSGLLAGPSFAGDIGPLIFDRTVHGPSLEHSLVGTSPDRTVRIYLPPGYYDSTRRYPVLYMLHAYSAGLGQLHRSLVPAIHDFWDTGEVQPMILVAPGVVDAYGGSFYGNSPVTRNWEDFIVQDLVSIAPSAPSPGQPAAASMGFPWAASERSAWP